MKYEFDPGPLFFSLSLSLSFFLSVSPPSEPPPLAFSFLFHWNDILEYWLSWRNGCFNRRRWLSSIQFMPWNFVFVFVFISAAASAPAAVAVVVIIVSVCNWGCFGDPIKSSVGYPIAWSGRIIDSCFVVLDSISTQISRLDQSRHFPGNSIINNDHLRQLQHRNYHSVILNCYAMENH